MSQPNGEGTSNQPNSGQQPDGQQQQHAAVDPQDLANMVNSAVAGHLKRALPKAIESILPTINEAVAKQVQDLKPPDKKSEPDDGKDKKPSPELMAMQREVETLTASLKAEKDARIAAETKARNDIASSTARKALTEGGARPELIDYLLKSWSVDGKLAWDDDGRPTLTIPFSPAKGMAEEDTTFALNEGVKHFLKSKDAAPFLPAPDGGGVRQRTAVSQRRPGQVPSWDKPAASDEEYLNRAATALSALGQMDDL